MRLFFSFHCLASQLVNAQIQFSVTPVYFFSFNFYSKAFSAHALPHVDSRGGFYKRTQGDLRREKTLSNQSSLWPTVNELLCRGCLTFLLIASHCSSDLCSLRHNTAPPFHFVQPKHHVCDDINQKGRATRSNSTKVSSLSKFKNFVHNANIATSFIILGGKSQCTSQWWSCTGAQVVFRTTASGS